MDFKQIKNIANNSNLSKEIRQQAIRLAVGIKQNYEAAVEAGISEAALDILKVWGGSTARTRNLYDVIERDGLKIFKMHGLPAIAYPLDVMVFDSGEQMAAKLGEWSEKVLKLAEEARAEREKREAEAEAKYEAFIQKQEQEASERLKELGERLGYTEDSLPAMPEPRYSVGTKVRRAQKSDHGHVFTVKDFDPLERQYTIADMHGDYVSGRNVPEAELYPADGPKIGDVATWRTSTNPGPGGKTVNIEVHIIGYEGEGNFQVADLDGTPWEFPIHASELRDWGERKPKYAIESDVHWSKNNLKYRIEHYDPVTNQYDLNWDIYNVPESELSVADPEPKADETPATPWWEDGTYHDCDIDQLNELADNGVSFTVLHPAADDDGDLTLTRVRIMTSTPIAHERDSYLKVMRWVDEEAYAQAVEDDWDATDIRDWFLEQRKDTEPAAR
jgi:hypothetical protein